MIRLEKQGAGDGEEVSRRYTGFLLGVHYLEGLGERSMEYFFYLQHTPWALGPLTPDTGTFGWEDALPAWLDVKP